MSVNAAGYHQEEYIPFLMCLIGLYRQIPHGSIMAGVRGFHTGDEKEGVSG